MEIDEIVGDLNALATNREGKEAIEASRLSHLHVSCTMMTQTR
jgi:hypothetical protein